MRTRAWNLVAELRTKWSPENAPTTCCGGGELRLPRSGVYTANYVVRGCPRGRSAHPRSVAGLGADGGERRRACACSGSSGRSGRRQGRGGRFATSLSDSFGAEEEGDVAELVVLLDMLGDASTGGGAAAELGHGARVREEQRENIGGERSRAARVAILSSRGQQRRRGGLGAAQRMATRRRGAAATGALGRYSEEDDRGFLETPLALFSSITNRSFPTTKRSFSNSF